MIAGNIRSRMVGERTVNGIMRTQIVSVPPEATVRELVKILAEEGISGAPVVGGDGRVLGVVSATDVVRFAAHESEIPSGEAAWGDRISVDGADADAPFYFFGPEEGNPFTDPVLDLLPGSGFDAYTVRDIMTPIAFSVRPGDTVEDVVEFLLRGRIHRALVVEDQRLLGIVTPFDVLRALYGEPRELAPA
jgi:CBS domain-containing protein